MTFKVANVITSFNSKSGGPPRTVALIATAGVGIWRAELFTTAHQESQSDSLLVAEFPGHVTVLPKRSYSWVGGVSMLAGISTAHRSLLVHGVHPDLVHIHGLWSPYLAAFAKTATQWGIPYVIAPHGMLEPWSLAVKPLRKKLALNVYQRALLDAAAALHATSELEARNMRALLGEKVPIFIVPNAVEESACNMVACRNDSAPEPRVMLFLSRLHEKKGLGILLEAWKQARPKNWHLLIVGSGEPRYVSKLKQICAADALTDVEFEPHLEGEAREAAFRRAAAFVLPTYSENFGNVVGEALMRGLPVITTTGTPWSDIVKHDCGWYINPTVSELKTALEAACSTDTAALRRMGERGRAYVSSQFTLPVIRNSLLRMYEAAMRPRD